MLDHKPECTTACLSGEAEQGGGAVVPPPNWMAIVRPTFNVIMMHVHCISGNSPTSCHLFKFIEPKVIAVKVDLTSYKLCIPDCTKLNI